MNKIFYIFLSLTLSISGIQAQDCDDVTATAVPTASTCQSNGSITITLSGASAGNLVGKQYSLKSTTGSLAIGPVSTNVFENLPPGTYNLEASGFCNSLAGPSIVRTVNNVTVGGSYQEPQLSFVATSATSTAAAPTSRNSYINCSTGLIVVLLQKGNQTSMPTFTITSAPAGVTVPQTVSATKATTGSATAGWRYMLDGTWPAGTYTVLANDGCYSATTSLRIDEITTVPPGGNGGYQPDRTPLNCSKTYHYTSYNYSATTYPDWYRYFADGLYEYGIAPLNETPNENNWFTVRNFSGSSTAYLDPIDFSPGTYPEYYGSSSSPTLSIYTRVKNCHSAITSINGYLTKPMFGVSSRGNSCEGITTYIISDNPTGLICYPVDIAITNNTGEEVYNHPNYMPTDSAIIVNCKYKEVFYLTVTDATGTQLLTNYKMDGIMYPFEPEPQVNTYDDRYDTYRYCDFYNSKFGTTNPCDEGYPNPVYVTVTDDIGTVIQRDTLTALGTKSVPNLKYGKYYTYTFVYPDRNNLTRTLTRIVNSTVPTGFTLSKYSTSSCGENRGVLRIQNSPTNSALIPGSTVTITGPQGYVSQTYTKPSQYPVNATSFDFPETYLPPGQYTATIESCGQTYTVTSTVVPGYTGDKLSYTLEQDCMGTKLFPSGGISNNGTPLSTVYFRMISAPVGSGADSKVIASTSNDYFSLTTPGTYILGMMPTNSITGCATKLDTIVYTPQPLALDRDKTSAYSCPTGNTGYLTLQATNGVLPYTYSIYDKTNTTLLYGPETSYSAIDLGDFGVANETYTVRMSDACSNSFNQQVTLVSLDRAALAYGQNMVCYGSPINIFAFTVTNATYSWTGPNGFTSTEKNPVIPNATSREAGWYKVVIVSQACNITVKDSINISVYDPVIPEELKDKMQEVTLCPFQALVVGQAATGGSGNYTYQWQYNSNTAGTGIWYDISGQRNAIFIGNNANYMFTSTIANPPYRYVRLVITDAVCGTYYLYYHTNVKGCQFLVNPDLKSPGIGN